MSLVHRWRDRDNCPRPIPDALRFRLGGGAGPSKDSVRFHNIGNLPAMVRRGKPNCDFLAGKINFNEHRPKTNLRNIPSLRQFNAHTRNAFLP